VTGRVRAAHAPAGAPVAGPRTRFRLSSLPRRLGALAYETLLLAALALVAGFLLLPLVSPTRAATPAIPPLFLRTMTFCVLTAAAAIYYGWFWSEGRRTLPQKTWRMRLVDVGGAPLPRATALVRYAAGWIGPAAAIAVFAAVRPAAIGRYAALLLLVNYAWAAIDPDRQFLHDRIAGTRVVDDTPVAGAAA
jgi:uncharacterized RDD family membrane protein YckC